MKLFFVILFSVMAVMGYSQQIDSLTRIDPKERSVKPPAKDAEKESFGDFVQNVGLGIWGKVKVRFNLEGLAENLEEKKNKFLGDKSKNKPTPEKGKPEVKSSN